MIVSPSISYVILLHHPDQLRERAARILARIADRRLREPGEDDE